MDYILRPWKQTDIESLIEQANNPRIAAFMTDAFPYPYSREQGMRFIDFATKDDPIHIFAIDIGGKAVGGIGIHPQADIMRKNAELGYWLGEAYWGKGIITKAIVEMIRFAFDTYDINRIFARPYGNNLASQRVLEKAGFVFEARLKNVVFKNGEYQDELIYGVRRNVS